METLCTCVMHVRGWFIAHTYNFIAGIMLAIGSYFAPIVDMLIVVGAAIGLDLITGLIASRVEGKGWKSKIFYRTIYKILCVFSVMALAFAIDTEIPVITIHKVLAWLIVGFEFWSILENMGRITDHPLFRVLKRFMHDKVQENTGVDLNEKDNV